MRSIRQKLFLQIGLLILFLIGLLFLANTLLLEPYNTYKQKNRLINYYDTINQMKTHEYHDNLYTFVAMENASNVNILLRSKDDITFYTSQAYLTNGPGRPPVEITGTEEINEKIHFSWGIDPMLREPNLILAGELDNGNFIELSIPYTSVTTNTQLTNQFLLIIGSIVMILAMLLAFLISSHFTKPIREMNKATEEMKNLNFDISCDVLSKDELGQLAKSINEMSIALSNTINSLNENNIKLQHEIEENIALQEKRRILLNNVSHELKTPISLIQGYSEALKLNITKSKERSDFYCDVLIDESLKMNQLIESLLSIDQINFDKNICNKIHFELSEFMRYNINKYEKLFKDKNINLTINVDSNTTIDAYSDIFLTERVLTNYITNAINYVDENLKIEINLFNLDHKARIEIFNTTPHIAETELAKIWDSFYKLDKSRSREKGGHGLGLSIVKAIQDALGNDYGVNNVENGIKFWFEVEKDNSIYETA